MAKSKKSAKAAPKRAWWKIRGLQAPEAILYWVFAALILTLILWAAAANAAYEDEEVFRPDPTPQAYYSCGAWYWGLYPSMTPKELHEACEHHLEDRESR